MSGSQKETTILIAEDEEELANLYKTWLRTEGYDIHTAYNGQEAIDIIDELGDKIDAALLDRMMPHYNGDEILEELRDRGIECGVSMVTAVEPDYDILEMGFDTYIQKPTNRDTIIETIEKLLRTKDYDGKVQNLLSLLSKKKSLEQEKSDNTLSEEDAYKELKENIETLRNELSEESQDDAIVDLLYNITGENLLVSVQYTPETWEFRYLDRKVESFFLNMEDTEMSDLIDVFRSQQQSHTRLNEIIDSDEHYVTLQLFDRFVYLQFYNDNGNGIMFGFDIDSVSNLTGFVADILPYLQKTDYFSTESEEPQW